MLTTENMKTGAAHNRRHARKNPTEVMVRLLEEDSHAPKEKIIERWWKIVREDDDYEEAIRDYAGTNAWDAIHRKPRPRQAPTIQDRAARSAEAQQIAANHVEKVLKLELSLDFVMFDGRKFGDWKGSELVKLGARFQRIGKKCGDKPIRSVIKTDKQLMEFS
jgi:hypothetical protein